MPKNYHKMFVVQQVNCFGIYSVTFYNDLSS